MEILNRVAGVNAFARRGKATVEPGAITLSPKLISFGLLVLSGLSRNCV